MNPPGGWFRRLLRATLLGMGGLLLTTLVASAFTALPVAWHFNRFATHGMLGNLAALPVLSLLVLPAAMTALALLPLAALSWLAGLTAAGDVLLGGPLWVVEQGLALMLAMAETIAALPGGWWHVPALSVWAGVLLAAGLLWLALRNDVLRLAGLLPIALVLTGLVPPFAPRPDVLVEDRARLVAARMPQGMADRMLAATPGRAGSFALRIWLRRDGDEATPAQARKRPGWTCDALICRARLAPSGLRVLYLRDVFRRRRGGSGTGIGRDERLAALQTMQRACTQADVVIAAFPLRGLCRGAGQAESGNGGAAIEGPRLIIDRFDVWRDGAHGLWQGEDGRIMSRSARQLLRGLPWAARPLARHEVLR